MDLYKVSESIGIAGMIAWPSAWLIKKIIQQSLAKDIEKFKFALYKDATEFKIKYSKLHGDRAEVIRIVYKKISRTYRSFSSYMCPFQEAGEPLEEEKAMKASKDYNSLVSFYEDNRIFFEEKLANEEDILIKEFKNCWIDYKTAKSLEPGHKRLQEWNKAWHKINKMVPITKGFIENRFRNIIGLENEYDIKKQQDSPSKKF